MSQNSMEKFINGIPKAELHLHVEGTFEPELMFEIAKRNNIKLRYESVRELKDKYNFNNLQEFLDIYYAGAGVLLKEQDFYDLTWAYLKKVHSQNVIHTEVFFDPQTHTSRGVKFSTAIEGIKRALDDGKKQLGITSKLIMCFLRHLDEKDCMRTLDMALDYKKWITAVGLDSSEVGNPPEKFKQVFEKSRNEGFLTVAHAGEEGPVDYIWGALDYLGVSRIDHGNRSMDDAKLIEKLVSLKMPLTLCPLSNLKLRVIHDMKHHPVKRMLDLGMIATIHSDDPAYFGGYMDENYLAVAHALNLSKQDIYQLSKNAFEASFLDQKERQDMINKLDAYYSLSN